MGHLKSKQEILDKITCLTIAYLIEEDYTCEKLGNLYNAIADGVRKGYPGYPDKECPDCFIR